MNPACKLCTIICASLFIFSCQKNTTRLYNIVDFGAVNDSTRLSTKAINDAIATCAAKGGGTVYIPNGRFYAGTSESTKVERNK